METQLPIDLSLYNNANIANGFVNFWTETVFKRRRWIVEQRCCPRKINSNSAKLQIL